MKSEITITMKYDDLSKLIALGHVVLESSDARAYCRGIGTTRAGMEHTLDRAAAALGRIVQEGSLTTKPARKA